MIFSDKISQSPLNNSDSENSKRLSENGNSNGQVIEPFPFSALHFIRNRLMPTGRDKAF